MYTVIIICRVLYIIKIHPCSPMDFLVTPRHRWVYVALFFVMAASLINTYASLSFNIQNVYFNILYSISKYKLTSFKFVL
jgi:hypothetical protein